MGKGKTDNRRLIVLDFDDTLVKSSEQIIRMINRKYGTNKTINDLSDWGYKSINGNVGQQEVLEMFGSDTFFDEVELNDYVQEFLDFAKDKYRIIICSKGDEANLTRKEKFCREKIAEDIIFEGLLFNDASNPLLDKSDIDFSSVLFAVDDNTTAVCSLNAPFKFLIKNYREIYWNKTPKNDTNTYIVQSFKDVLDFCKFDEKLKAKGVIIGGRKQ